MPVVMREKMEGAFGMDLSGVKLYENKAVGKAGAEAVTQGSRIAFAPGRLDFSSTHGQALLGHEISHVASQARGEVKGSGLVNDHALEARADREGLMAARGESVASGYGSASAALSNASAASASGPMQAKSGKKKQLEGRAREDMASADPWDLRESEEDNALDAAWYKKLEEEDPDEADRFDVLTRKKHKIWNAEKGVFKKYTSPKFTLDHKNDENDGVDIADIPWKSSKETDRETKILIKNLYSGSPGKRRKKS